MRHQNGERAHKQQAPIALLLRIILSSTLSDDFVLDPFAGTGTTLIVAEQLGRTSVGVEIDPKNVQLIQQRLTTLRQVDSIEPLRDYYRFTPNLERIWQGSVIETKSKTKQLAFLERKPRYKKNGNP